MRRPTQPASSTTVLSAHMRGRAVTLAAFVVVVVNACGSTDDTVDPAAVPVPVPTPPASGPASPSTAAAPTGAVPGVVTTAPGSVVVTAAVATTELIGDVPGAVTVPIAPADIDGVVPDSVPIVLAEHFGSVQLAVRAAVGIDVFTGAGLEDNDSADITMSIHGTDVAAIEAALDAIGTEWRDRITVVESEYSLRQLESFAVDAQQRLDEAAIGSWVGVQPTLGAVSVTLTTPDGQPDAVLDARAREVLDGLPVVIEFGGVPVPG